MMFVGDAENETRSEKKVRFENVRDYTTVA